MMYCFNLKLILSKVANRVALEKNRMWKYLPVDRISRMGYNVVSATAIRKRLASILGEFNPSIIKGIKQEERERILFCADRALDHHFDLLGGCVSFGSSIDWHYDFKSGKRWDIAFYKQIKTPSDADIKVPWELSRCQHLLWLGEAYLLTNDTRYAQSIINDINSWIDDNPFMFSVNWMCSMDVAFRAVNWIFAINMISSYDGFDNDFSSKVSSSLYQHGFFIRNNLEKLIPYSNNHYTSDLVGLLYIGLLFSNTYKGKKWFSYAYKEFLNEIRNQVLPSGIHYEKSISYHRMMTEMLSYPIYMLNRVGISVPNDIESLLGKMYEFVSNYSESGNSAPLLGDNDDGRFLPFVPRPFSYHNYINDPVSVENRFISIGYKPKYCSSFHKSMFYDDARLAILQNEDSFLLFSNVGYSKRPLNKEMLIGTHTHNDQLSVSLNVRKEEILVDPGTYLYTPSPLYRNLFRSTAYHNTLVVDDEEQNNLTGINLFCVRRNSINHSMRRTGDCDIAASYSTIVGGMTHDRICRLMSDSLTIVDTVLKQGKDHSVSLFFHVSPNIKAELGQTGFALTSKNSNISVIINKKADLFIKDGFVSPSYGVLKPSIILVAKMIFDNSISIQTTIRWITIDNTE